MTKYEIMHDRFEFNDWTSKYSFPTATAEQIFDWYMNLADRCPNLVGSYATEEEAREAFQECRGSTSVTDGWVHALLVGDVYWIEINEYDEAGEFDQGGNVIAFSADGYVSWEDQQEQEETDE